MNSEGHFQPISSLTSNLDLPQVKNQRSKLIFYQAQGRVIVQPKIRDEIIHEVWVELQDADWDRGTGNITRKGNFSSIIRALPEYKRQLGITTLYVMGALDRPPWAGPFSPIDRSTPNRYIK